VRSGKRATNVVASERSAKDVAGGGDGRAFFQCSVGRFGQLCDVASDKAPSAVSLARLLNPTLKK